MKVNLGREKKLAEPIATVDAGAEPGWGLGDSCKAVADLHDLLTSKKRLTARDIVALNVVLDLLSCRFAYYGRRLRASLPEKLRSKAELARAMQPNAKFINVKIEL